MARKPRAGKRRVEGVWQVDSGTARVLADPARDGAYVLEVNDVPSSHVVLGAPRVLEFEYMQWIAALLRPLPLADAHIVHLGGAACSLARWAADVWPSSRNTVVEIDGALSRLVREVFDIPASVRSVVGEARTITHSLAEGSVDVLIRDVFAGPVTPHHLTTVEYFRACRRVLVPGGLYLANCGDRGDCRRPGRSWRV
ncbi:spermidine synthase [Corynebacterium guangdongense]|uniref:Spermidine synthase n=1 Tax=Corynebacterium guangdongense TaxID=1783348 RepID=A0ABU2A0N4_9CORY|nr:fused MFS/spermidine synthase [Corynebacterium guangdongense]MDR7330734.1 spermidine synthase [Corynebacterium guangdongense]WJZ16749.1 spermidine synthase [Corynebacterium guangdongense]